MNLTWNRPAPLSRWRLLRVSGRLEMVWSALRVGGARSRPGNGFRP